MRFLTAEKVFNGRQYLSAGTVLVLNDQNLLSDILPAGQIEQGRIQKLDGILTPGFVNAHCHLELSHLKNKIRRHTGFAGFAIELMSKRGGFSPEEVAEHMRAADRDMTRNGIVAAGDICNGPESIRVKTMSSIFYHSYVELIGLNPAYAQTVFDKGKDLYAIYRSEGLSASLAAHAPYSVSAELVEMISRFDAAQALPFSIHNQESKAEEDFLMGRQNSINGLYDFLKLDISYFNAPEKNSLMHLGGKITAGPRTFVHNTFSKSEDLMATADERTFWCLCPNANLYIEDALPDFALFLDLNVCLGTDSLASNDTLDLVAEANIILSSGKMTADKLLTAMTSGGAAALGLQERFGLLSPGKDAGLNQVTIKENKIRFNQKIC